MRLLAAEKESPGKGGPGLFLYLYSYCKSCGKFSATVRRVWGYALGVIPTQAKTPGFVWGNVG